MSELVQQIIDRVDAGERLAVCLLAKATGSTPQKAGAIMIVLGNGKSYGTIGGGCVEAEVRAEALRQLAATPDYAKKTADRLFRFELNRDYGWDDGLICGGNMFVAIQVVDSPDKAGVWRQAHDQLKVGQAAKTRISVTDEAGQKVEVQFEQEPSPTLIIAGGGHVGAALAGVAVPMGFRVTVIDDRSAAVSSDRFPSSHRIIGPIDKELRRLSLNKNSYVVIVTRGHRNDGQALDAVVRSSARYIGLIGSRRKILSIFEALFREGVSAEQLRRVHAPIGLRIGAQNPTEIAVSIAAELIAVRHGQPLSRDSVMQLEASHLDRLISRNGFFD